MPDERVCLAGVPTLRPPRAYARARADATYRDRDGLAREHGLEVLLEGLPRQAVRADVVKLLFTHPSGKASARRVFASQAAGLGRVERGRGPARWVLYSGRPPSSAVPWRARRRQSRRPHRKSLGGRRDPQCSAGRPRVEPHRSGCTSRPLEAALTCSVPLCLPGESNARPPAARPPRRADTLAQPANRLLSRPQRTPCLPCLVRLR